MIFNLSGWFRKPFGLRDHTALADGFGASARPVTTSTTLSLSTVWACVRLVSQSVAVLPCGVFSRDAEGDKIAVKPEQLSLVNVLKSRPNLDMPAVLFFQAVVASMLLRGNSYSIINYRGSGATREVVSLDPLHPDQVDVNCKPDGSLTYTYYDDKGKTTVYTEDRILHIRNFTLDGRVGLSAIAYGRLSISGSLAIEETSAKFYGNGMKRPGALSTDQLLKENQRNELRKSVADQLDTVAKKGGNIILEAGMKYEALSIAPDDAQMLESRSFSVPDICRWFGVQPAMIGHTEKTTTWGTGLEQMNIGFITYTLTPIIRSIEQEINRKLVPVADRDKYFAEFNIDAFLRSDSAGRAALYSSASQNGWMTRAEIRRKENLPYKEGSDELTVQLAQTNLQNLDKVNPVASEENL